MTFELRAKLRKSLRAARQALSPRQQRHAALHLFRAAIRQPFFRTARHIAFYLPFDGEIDPGLLLHQAHKDGKHCYLPVISRCNPQRLKFVPYEPGERLYSNRWGIREPLQQRKKCIAPWTLDLVFVPLTGFDSSCNRLGMGKGFYDRTFYFKLKLQRRKPVLIGLAHEFQKLGALSAESWDVPLNGVISDRAVYRQTAGRQPENLK